MTERSLPTAGVLRAFRGRVDAIVDDLAELVLVETPSEDLEALTRGVHVLESMSTRLIGQAQSGSRWTGASTCAGRGPLPAGARRVPLVGHFDTV